jgi:glycosyltransferase involved in cell wall biosynthesis
MSKEKIVIVSAVQETILAFLSNQLVSLSDEYITYVICSNAHDIPKINLVRNVEYIDISIRRIISPFNDVISLIKLILFFKQHEFTLIQSITPKAGLLSLLAAWVCGIPIRVHVFTGQVWVTKSGFSRWYLKSFDRLIAMLATSLLADSPSQMKFLIAEGVTREKDIAVLADGSICGVDALRFKPNEKAKMKVRSQMGIPEEAIVALFMGRLKKDKGVLDLALVFGKLDSEVTNLYMIFVGPDEEGLANKIVQLATPRNNQIRFMGSVNNPEDFFAAADFLCLPSYREGFGLVIIEAAGAGIPTLGSCIYGITDAIVDGITGFLHQPGDLVGLSKGLLDMTMNTKKRQTMGYVARKRVLELFPTSRVVGAQLRYYKSLIQKYRSHG